MDSYTSNSAWGASLHLMRERGLAPITGVQGTGVPAAGYGKARQGFGFQPAAASPLGTTGMAVAVNDTDVRVPPRGRPL